MQKDYIPFFHKYIVYTDHNRTEWIARGGPENRNPLSPGKLDTRWGKLDKTFDEYLNAKTDPRETLKSGADLSADWGKIKQSLSSFDMKFRYEPLGNNSNATVDTALRDAGLKKPKLDNYPNGVPRYWSPGHNFIIPKLPLSELVVRLFPPSHPGRHDPLVLDLNGDGVKLTSLVGSKVNFDFGGDGFAEKTGWVSAQDGLLTLDKNNNGKIDNGSELFGSAREDGFTALAHYDLNQDGKINSSDAVFAKLRVWRDANGNGVTDKGELLTLAQAGVQVGIKEISLEKKASGVDNSGNRIDFTCSFTRTNGKSGDSVAVIFSINQTLAKWTPPAGFKVSAEAGKLPGQLQLAA